jgi:hypothetical protein
MASVIMLLAIPATPAGVQAKKVATLAATIGELAMLVPLLLIVSGKLLC